MARWTGRQEELLREYGHLGAEAVRDLIADECGVAHTVRAIITHASRIHASLRVREECPDCGAVGVTLNRRSGLCARCTELMHLREGIAFSEILAWECEETAKGPGVEEIARERDRIRQQNNRLCKKYGLPTLRGRKRGAGCLCPGCEHFPDCSGPICDRG